MGSEVHAHLYILDSIPLQGGILLDKPPMGHTSSLKGIIIFIWIYEWPNIGLENVFSTDPIKKVIKFFAHFN